PKSDFIRIFGIAHSHKQNQTSLFSGRRGRRPLQVCAQPHRSHRLPDKPHLSNKKRKALQSVWLCALFFLFKVFERGVGMLFLKRHPHSCAPVAFPTRLLKKIDFFTKKGLTRARKHGIISAEYDTSQ
ncbi:MAG: hypothetical protein IJW22_03620, partial [Clostridia bacterium]|nr:hypothetical protein [Clostridia bacterium]